MSSDSERLAVTGKDWLLLKMLIENPSLSDSEVAEELGVTRQSVGKRRKRLEEKGLLRRYVFLGAAYVAGLAKFFRVEVGGGEDFEEFTRYLSSTWRVPIYWVRGRYVEGIVLVEDAESFKRFLSDEFPSLGEVEVEPVRIAKFLSEKIETRKASLEGVAQAEARKESEGKGVRAVIYRVSREEKLVHIYVVKDRRCLPRGEPTYIHRVRGGVPVKVEYGTYDSLKAMLKSKLGRKRLKEFKVAYARDKGERKRISMILRLARH